VQYPGFFRGLQYADVRYSHFVLSNVQCPMSKCPSPSQMSTWALGQLARHPSDAVSFLGKTQAHHTGHNPQEPTVSPCGPESVRTFINTALALSEPRSRFVCPHAPPYILASSDMVNFPTPIGGNITDDDIGRKVQSHRGFRPSSAFQYLPPFSLPFTLSSFPQSLGIISSATNGAS